MPKSLVITHFFNEEFLLPWWLKHHVKLFDHGVLIDYASTDRSVAICRELAPNWEVHTSRNTYFDAELCDAEVMDIERAYARCWKIALNTTEFLCTSNMQGLLKHLDLHGWDAYAIRGVILVDPPTKSFMSDPPNPELPLVQQSVHGYFEDESPMEHCSFLAKNRILHRAECGSYTPGRHGSTQLIPFMHPPDAFVSSLLYSPLCAQFIKRKLQIQTRIPESDKKRNFGSQHLVTEAQLQETWSRENKKIRHLVNDSDYCRAIGLNLPASTRGDFKPTAQGRHPALGYAYKQNQESPEEMIRASLAEALHSANEGARIACEGLCRNLIARAQNVPFASNHLAALYCSRNKFQSAREVLVSALRVDPTSLVLRCNLMQICDLLEVPLEHTSTAEQRAVRGLRSRVRTPEYALMSDTTTAGYVVIRIPNLPSRRPQGLRTWLCDCFARIRGQFLYRFASITSKAIGRR